MGLIGDLLRMFRTFRRAELPVGIPVSPPPTLYRILEHRPFRPASERACFNEDLYCCEYLAEDGSLRIFYDCNLGHAVLVEVGQQMFDLRQAAPRFHHPLWAIAHKKIIRWLRDHARDDLHLLDESWMMVGGNHPFDSSLIT